MSSMHSLCRSCSAPIIWTITEAGKRMPLDDATSDDGNVELIAHAFAESAGLSRVLSGAALTAAREAGTPLRRSHFATCEHASAWRRPTQARST